MHAGLKEMWRQLAAIVQTLTAVAEGARSLHRRSTTEAHTFICEGFLPSIIYFNPPPQLFLPELLSQLADDMTETKHQLRNGRNVRCILLKMSVDVKIKDKPSVKLREMRGCHTLQQLLFASR